MGQGSSPPYLHAILGLLYWLMLTIWFALVLGTRVNVPQCACDTWTSERYSPVIPPLWSAMGWLPEAELYQWQETGRRGMSDPRQGLQNSPAEPGLYCQFTEAWAQTNGYFKLLSLEMACYAAKPSGYTWHYDRSYRKRKKLASINLAGK